MSLFGLCVQNNHNNAHNKSGWIRARATPKPLAVSKVLRDAFCTWEELYTDGPRVFLRWNWDSHVCEYNSLLLCKREGNVTGNSTYLLQSYMSCVYIGHYNYKPPNQPGQDTKTEEIISCVAICGEQLCCHFFIYHWRIVLNCDLIRW